MNVIAFLKVGRTPHEFFKYSIGQVTNVRVYENVIILVFLMKVVKEHLEGLRSSLLREQ